MRFFALCLIGVIFATPGFAQQDEKGFLVTAIQDALSGAGRDVRIDGFRGALSSAASFDRMTIADKEGIWVTLEGVVLDWNRSALLRGRLEVERLSARAMDLPRLPVAEQAALPQAEATPFSLPDLPVSIDIQTFAVDQITLGAPVLGQAAQLQITAQAVYNADEASANILAKRLDDRRGSFAFTANFARATSVVEMLLTLSEDAGGIAATVLNLPGQPAVNMRVVGVGPLDDLSADIAISSDGAERLAGKLSLKGGDAGRHILADIGGDITALLAPRYRAFFGQDLRLRLDALQRDGGELDIDSFSLRSEALDIKGEIALDREMWPQYIDVTGRIENRDGTRVVLPVSGGATQVRQMLLDLDFDASQGDVMRGEISLSDLSTGGADVARTGLTLDGTLTAATGSIRQFLGDLSFDAKGIALLDGAMSEAIGSDLSGKAQLAYAQDEPLRVSGFALAGADYGVSGNVVLRDGDDRLRAALDADLDAQNLSRFSALAGRELAGVAEVSLKGDVRVLDGMFDLAVRGQVQDIRTGIPQADAVLEGQTELNMQALRDETGTFLRDLSLTNAALDFKGDVALRSEQSNLVAQATLNDIAVVLPQYDGPVTISGSAAQGTLGWDVDVQTQGPYSAALSAKGRATGPNAALAFTAEVPEVARFAPQAKGPLSAKGYLRHTNQGWHVQADAQGPFDATAVVDGLVSPMALNFTAQLPDAGPLYSALSGAADLRGTLRQGETGIEIDTTLTGPINARARVQGALTPAVDVAFDLDLPSLEPITGLAEPLAAQGRLRQSAAGFDIETTLSGPYQSSGDLRGQIVPAVAVSFDLRLPNLNAVVAQVDGPLRVKGDLRQADTRFFVDAAATGPSGASAVIEGLANGPDMSLTFAADLPDVAPFAPGLSGPFAAKGSIAQTPKGIDISTNATGPYATRASVKGIATGPDAALRFDLAMANVAALVDQVNGPLNVTGTARKQGAAWRLDTNALGPSGTQARVTGLANTNGTLNLDIDGTAPLGLAEPFLKPRSLSGLARFDLALNGAPALSSLSGNITAKAARFAAPNLRLALQDINLNVALAESRATLDISGVATGGGGVQISGPISLSGAMPADLAITLQGLVLSDPRLYRTAVDGALRLTGPIGGGAVVSGRVAVGETNVSVPSTGITSIGEIPAITHIGDAASVRATRNRAGLAPASSASPPTKGSTGGFGLDLTVNAPNRIFVRGRGLDAELGGALNLGGTTGRILSSGQFDLIRGRLDILGKRFDLVEGSASFEGDLVPYIRFVSATTTSAGDISVIVEGPADAPEVTFQSNPEAPQDEVLAQLLFGRDITEISAFQALQLASAVATLAGRGGTGVVARLREGFGLDDLDITTTDDGATAVRAGKYISDNVYTDVTATSDGTGEVSLNLDLTPNLTAKGRLGSNGDTGIGLFFEKDY